ncbi:hypothetical protein Shyd_81360 [Streptomyces hydrogenans]|uniref:Uncharacterized protein n=1 Tax=Streptomyces hydrogenans TaxID=1873719 RepID=A0ABQ3PP13_9ACTN|nr:hypothetical protein GCM10018784_16000 [Streptomyces hydrogenans]GHI26765.1 hypothetical protein Shyd_81360 [Streptomyces hydrogenans]
MPATTRGAPAPELSTHLDPFNLIQLRTPMPHLREALVRRPYLRARLPLPLHTRCTAMRNRSVSPLPLWRD